MRKSGEKLEKTNITQSSNIKIGTTNVINRIKIKLKHKRSTITIFPNQIAQNPTNDADCLTIRKATTKSKHRHDKPTKRKQKTKLQKMIIPQAKNKTNQPIKIS
jgi:hypothetical protein